MRISDMESVSRDLSKVRRLAGPEATLCAAFPGRVLVVLLAVLVPAICLAEDIYVAKNATGSANGSSCSNAYAVSFFNTASKWANPKRSGKIGPGDTIHLCGTITGSAGSCAIDIGFANENAIDGTAGAPITLKFETGAVLTAPYWGSDDGTNPQQGAITIERSYWIIDGGTNGTIINTANGTGLTYQKISAGVVIGRSTGTPPTNVEVKNLTMTNMYARTPCSHNSDNGGWGSGVFMRSLGNNISIHNNRITSGRIVAMGGTASNLAIYANTVSLVPIGIVVVNSTVNGVLSNISIHDNEIKDMYAGWDPENQNHLNGMAIWGTANGTVITGNVYNNYIHGNFGTVSCGAGGHTTAWIYANSVGYTNAYQTLNLYNNLLVADVAGDYPANCFITCGGASDTLSTYNVWNNTIVGSTTSAGIGIGASGGTIAIQNNLISTVGLSFGGDSGGSRVSNHNLVYNVNTNNFATWNGSFQSLAQWQALGFDNDIITSNPKMNSNYALQSDSRARDHGTSLASYFTTDKNGVSRPQGSGWDIGCYEYSGGGGSGASEPSDSAVKKVGSK